MRVLNTTRTAFTALRRNPMRALLTTLGVVIGVGAVIAMMEIGAGSKIALNKSIASMGANVMAIQPGNASNSGISFGAGTTTTLTPEDCTAIHRECPAIRSTAPMVRTRAQVVYGNRNWVLNAVYGTTPDFLDVQNREMAEGEPFTDHDLLASNRVCILGKTVVKELFDDESPLGKDIRIKNIAFRVIGVFAAKGSNMMGSDQDDLIVAPWTTIKYRVSDANFTNMVQSSSTTTDSVNSLSNLYPASEQSLYPEQSITQQTNQPMPVRFANVDQIMAAAVSATEITAASDQIKAVLRERHQLASDEPDDFTIRDMTELTRTLSTTTSLMTNLLLSVAMISLVVGGVGIMNIMLVSVTERTREIGLRMAVGARARDILRQFLVEAVVLCLSGGAIGILLGHGGSLLVELLLNWPVETSPTAIATAVAVSAGVGIIFGFYPAWKASHLAPIEALRYE